MVIFFVQLMYACFDNSKQFQEIFSYIEMLIFEIYYNYFFKITHRTFVSTQFPLKGFRGAFYSNWNIFLCTAGASEVILLKLSITFLQNIPRLGKHESVSYFNFMQDPITLWTILLQLFINPRFFARLCCQGHLGKFRVGNLSFPSQSLNRTDLK